MDVVELVASNSSAGEDDENCEREVCLKRVGRISEWLCLVDSTEITVGRGLNVTYQLLSPINPLMISRLHCTFKQREDGQWTVTDQKSLNGVWVNGKRVPAEKPHRLQIGDSLQLGVPINGTIDYEYILSCLPKKDITPYLAKVSGENAPSILKKTKRKSNNILDETEPSTSSKPKRYRRSIADNTPDQSCPVVEDQARARTKQPVVSSSSKHVHGIHVRSEGTSNPCDLDSLQRFSQNILMLREQVDDTQKQVASLKGEPQQVDPVRGEQFTVLQNHLQTLTTKMRRMETLEKSFSETKKQMAAEKSQQEEDVLKKQLEDALQEQKKVMEELTFSRQDFQKILLAKDNDLLAKDKELQMTKERAQAQKDEVVTQVTEVLENELQCIICSELFIQAVNLNCAHSFCMRCIGEWRKKKNECPICRGEIQSQTRCLALDNCIERMVENLSPEMKERRLALVAERKAAEPLVIPDEDSTHSISSLNDSDDDSVLSLDSSSNSVISVNSERVDRRFRSEVVQYSSSSYTDEDDVIED